MQPLTVVFLIALGLWLWARLWLNLRQARNVARHRELVPEPFQDQVSLTEHQKAADYTLARTRLNRATYLADTLILLAWTLGGGLQALDEAWRAALDSPLLVGTAVMVSALLIMGALELPASAYRTFVIEERFGFNRTTHATFVADALKGGALLLIIGVPFSLLVLWLMHHTGQAWWLWVWAAWLGLSLAMTWAYPALIAPLFNRFRPLDRAGLDAQIRQLLERCGFRTQGIYVMDGSRRSAHGNAYFTGLGRAKRIVFFDTLLDALEDRQVIAVLAHELGHFKRRHVIKGLAVSAAVGLAGLAVLAWLMEQTWFYRGLGVDRPSVHTALLLFLLVAPVFSFFLQPALTWLSRRHEYEADAFAAQQTQPQPLIEALVRLYRSNATTLTPDPLHSAVYDSHPPAMNRIARLRQIGGVPA